jgi:prepilin-type N-terminal cleavage/methylation domain-containing protein
MNGRHLRRRRRGQDVLRRGFTLVELLVVIGIIALLVAILLPSLSRAMTKAREVNCLSNARQLAIGVMMYVDEFKGVFPASADYAAPTDEPTRVWTSKVLPYVKNTGVYICPAVADGKFASDWAERGLGTIGYTTATASDPADVEGFSTQTKISMIRSASLVPLFGDTPGGPTADKYRGFTFDPYNGVANADDPVLGTPLVSDKDLVQQLNTLSPAQLKPLIARHSGRVVLIFADAHAEPFASASILQQEKGAALHWRFRPKPVNAP